MPSVTLREIGPDIADAVLVLRVSPGQERFVAPVAQSFHDAVDEPEGNAWMRAVPADGGHALVTSCVTGMGSPQPFHEGLGFVPTGELDPDGEVIVALDLATGPTR